MADGTFAVLMLLAGIESMHSDYCPTGCLQRTEVTPRFAVSAGSYVERRTEPGAELYARYDFGHRNGPFGHTAGLSIGERGELWAGIGQTYSFGITGNLTAELHAMTGLYEAGDGLDLGGPIAFRSGIMIEYEGPNGWRYGLGYDHRSNAGIYRTNPGIETVLFRVSAPLN
ncbi:MAG: acyloxyacyl hydrolase, partial [Paracoccaceae bacterium]